jgi:hypothetical protein
MFKEVARDLCQPEVVCGNDVIHSPYRTFDGSCNNLYNTQWGKTRTPQRRSLPANYSDRMYIIYNQLISDKSGDVFTLIF